MAFDLHITIPEDSPLGFAVQHIAIEQHLTPEEAVNQLLTEAAKLHEQKSPAEQMWGAFSSEEDSAITDEAMNHVRALRSSDRLRDFGA